MIKKIVFLAIIGIAIGFGVYKYAMRNVADISNEKPKFITTFSDINTKINNNDSSTLSNYTNQIISVSGKVSLLTKGDSTITISIGDTASLNTIECQIDKRHSEDFVNVKENEAIVVKGICAGSTMDDMGLGGSLQLKNCVFAK